MVTVNFKQQFKSWKKYTPVTVKKERKYREVRKEEYLLKSFMNLASSRFSVCPNHCPVLFDVAVQTGNMYTWSAYLCALPDTSPQLHSPQHMSASSLTLRRRSEPGHQWLWALWAWAVPGTVSWRGISFTPISESTLDLNHRSQDQTGGYDWGFALLLFIRFTFFFKLPYFYSNFHLLCSFCSILMWGRLV